MEIDSLSSQIDSLSFEKYQMMDKLHQVENEYYLGKYSDERQDTLLRTMASLKYDIKFKDIQIELRREKREKLNDIKLENEYGK